MMRRMMRKKRTLTSRLWRPRLAGTGRNTRSAAAAAKKAKEAKAAKEAKTTEGQKKAGQSKSAKADKKSNSPVPARRTTRAFAKIRRETKDRRGGGW